MQKSIEKILLKKKTAEYKRTSSGGQDLKLQTETNAEYLNDIPEDEKLVFTDFDVSATKLPMNDRPALTRMLKMIENKTISRVVVYERDRLARNVYEYIAIVKQFYEHDVEVIFTSSDAPPFSKDLFMETWYGLSAQFEGQRISSRLSDARKRNPGSLIGYKKQIVKNGNGTSQRIYKADPQNKNDLVELFKEFSSVESREEIYDVILKFQGLLSRSELRIIDILRTPFYSAHYEGADGLYHRLTNVEAIIPIELFIKVQEKLVNFEHELLQGIAYSQKIAHITPICIECSNELKFKKGKIGESGTYKCPNHRKNSISSSELNDSIIQSVKEALNQISTNSIKKITLTAINNQIKQFNKQSDELLFKLESLCIKFSSLFKPTHEYKEMRRLQEQIVQAREQLSTMQTHTNSLHLLKDEVQLIIEQVADGLQQLNERDYLDLADLLINSILVCEDHIQFQYYFSDFFSETEDDPMSKIIIELIKHAVGIVRVSSSNQLHNASIETQIEEIRLRAKREGYTIIEIFIDGGNSAYHKNVTKREAMNDLLEATLSEDLNIEAVFFYDESRLSRQFYDFPLFVYDVIKKKKPHVKFFSTLQNEEWDPYNLLSVVNFATAANHSVTLSRRAKDAQKTGLSKQERPGSSVPYGYKLRYPFSPDENEKSRKEKGEQVVDDAPATIVLFIFYLASWGHSQRSISDLLNAAKVPSPESKLWSSGTIDYILDNDQYLGHLAWNVRSSRNTSRKRQRGEFDLIFNHHDPIVSVSLWNMAHQTIDLHKKIGKNNKSNFILRGLLSCKECDETLITKNETPRNSKKPYLVYRCPSCKNKLEMIDVHDVVLNEVSSKWVFTITQIKDSICNLIKKRKKKIVEYRDSIKEQITGITLKEDFITNSSELINNKTCDWDFILSVSKSKLKRELHKANTFLEQIELLDEDIMSNEIFNLMNLSKLQNVEIRTLLLTLYKRIDVDFPNGKLLYVQYKLAPFTAIEQYLDYIDSK